jgi:hypothetical protein
MKTLFVALAAASVFSGTAHATLEGRDLDGNLATFEAYYDNDFNVTWLADANYAKTSGYRETIVNGGMTQESAITWAANLSFTDSAHNVTYDNWRLPSALSRDGTQCLYYNCTNSEMGHMFYGELGGIARQSISSIHNENYALFVNIEPYYYWSYDSGSVCRNFNFKEGYQCDGSYFSNGFNAWAVSDGNVGIAPVPEPSTWMLMLTGFTLLGAATSRRRSDNSFQAISTDA